MHFRISLLIYAIFTTLLLMSHSVIVDAQDSDRFIINVGGKYGFIDSSGAVVIQPRYSSVHNFSEGLAAVNSDGKSGFVDPYGKEVIPLVFQAASDFSEGVAVVDTGNSRGRAAFVDHKGKLTLLTCVIYSEEMIGFSGAFSEGLLPVTVGNQLTYIDRICNPLVKPDAIRGSGFSEGLAAVSSGDGKHGYIDRTGKVAIPYEFLDAASFSEGLALVNIDGKYGYINASGQVVIAPQFRSGSRNFHEGFAVVESESKQMGYINKSGGFAVQPKYQGAWDFSEGLAAVQTFPGKDRNDFSVGYIDQRGRQVIKPQFIEGEDFVGGIAQVMIHGKFAYVDRTGQVVWPVTGN